MVLAPDDRADEDIQGGYGRAPGHLGALFEPFGMLVEHRRDDMDERFVRCDQAVAPGKQVAFEPSFERMLGKHLHDPAVVRQFAAVGVFGPDLFEPGFFRYLIRGLEAVRGGFIGSEKPEVGHVVAHDIAEVSSEHPGIFRTDPARTLDRHGIGPHVGKAERFADEPGIGDGVGAHPPLPLGRQCPELRCQGARSIEQLLGFITFKPRFENFQVGRIVMDRDRHLVRTPRTLRPCARQR